MPWAPHRWPASRVVHDSDALIFRNGIEQDMTPLERVVYKARIAPIVDADARLQTLAKTAERIRVSCGLPMMQADRVRRIELALAGALRAWRRARRVFWRRNFDMAAPRTFASPQRLLAFGPFGVAPGRDAPEAIGGFESEG